MKKICGKCKIEKSHNEFYKNSNNVDLLTSQCKQCFKNNYDIKKYDAEEKNKFKLRSAKYRKNNPDKVKKCINEWSKENYDKVKFYVNNYRKRNMQSDAAHSAKDRALKLQRIPKWISKEELKSIKDFYKNCPNGYHVDHIVPLQGEIVSGFHCLSNLQYLSSMENIIKGNKFNFDEYCKTENYNKLLNKWSSLCLN
jgi:hypothetical protein